MFWYCDTVILKDYLEIGRIINTVVNIIPIFVMISAMHSRKKDAANWVRFLFSNETTPVHTVLALHFPQYAEWDGLCNYTFCIRPIWSQISPLLYFEKKLEGNHFTGERDMKRTVSQWLWETLRGFFDSFQRH